MSVTEKKDFYIKGIQEAYRRGDFKKVLSLWDSLMNEKTEAPCGLEPNADLIYSVRNRVVKIIIASAKHLNA